MVLVHSSRVKHLGNVISVRIDRACRSLEQNQDARTKPGPLMNSEYLRFGYHDNPTFSVFSWIAPVNRVSIGLFRVQAVIVPDPASIFCQIISMLDRFDCEGATIRANITTAQDYTFIKPKVGRQNYSRLKTVAYTGGSASIRCMAQK